MDITELLKQDHKELKAHLNRLEATTGRATKLRQKLLDWIATAFETHAKAEEMVFYRRFMEDPDGKSIAYEGLEEHKLARTALQDLVKTGVDNEAFEGRLKVFKDVVEHHIEEEESEFFNHGKECFEDELDEMGERFESKKSELEGRRKLRLAG